MRFTKTFHTLQSGLAQLKIEVKNMLTSLYKIGEQLSAQVSEFYSIIDYPKVDETKKNYNLEIIFDLDKKEIIIDNSRLSEYSPNDPILLKNIKILPGNFSKIYTCVEFDKIGALKKSFFGVGVGEFAHYIITSHPKLTDTQFNKALVKVNELKEFASTISKKEINEKLDLGNNVNIILVFASIISTELNLPKKTKFAELNGYNDFLSNEFYPAKGKDGLCYTNKSSSDIIPADFITRYSLNKVFVTTTKNYAINFDGNLFSKNYQISSASKRYLDIASKYLLKNSNVRIAGISHIIIPQFLSYSNINYNDISQKLNSKVDLVFKTAELESFTQDVSDELNDLAETEVYWLNFIAFESDGNYLKIINQIKDVNIFHFIKVSKVFIRTGISMKNFIGSKYIFNFGSIYHIIPEREGKTKKNRSLTILGDILEQRKILSEVLFDYFTELILCHYYKRYTNYKNIFIFQNNEFDFAIKDTVFKYLLVFKVLQNLGQLSNHNFIEANMSSEETNNNKMDFSAKIEDFFSKMSYSDSQKAMFYLGRMLNTIAYAQYKKEHKQKPILQKINYNGMDKDDIQQLRLDLYEKAKQYRTIKIKGEEKFIIRLIEINDAYFVKLFNFNNWDLKPKEALFFILSGYSFGLTVSNEEKEILNEMEEIDNE